VPEGDSVPWEAQPDPWGVLGGILSTKMASPTGTGPIACAAATLPVRGFSDVRAA
jgi:hypothetical protein